MPKVFSLSDVRIASTTGHVVLIEANVPKNVPEVLYNKALSLGCIPYEPEQAAKLKEALAVLEAAEAAESGEPPVVVEAPVVVEPDNDDAVIRRTIIQLVMENDPVKLKNDGSPKVAEVRKLLPEGIDVDPGTVYDIYTQIDLENRLDGDGETGSANT